MSTVIHKPSKPAMTRRRFLRDLGVSAAAVPLLVGLDSLYAKADVPVIPKKRFIYMYSPGGLLYSAWRLPVSGPTVDLTGNGASILNDPARSLQPLYKNASRLLLLDRLSLIAARPVYQDITALKQGVSNLPGQPLATVDGIDHPGGEQKGMGNLLTGQVLIGGAQNFGNAGLANGISVDQVIANNLFKGKVPFPSLQIAVMGTNDLYSYNDRQVDKVLSYTAPTKPLTPVSDPFVLFNQLFGSGAGSTRAFSLRELMDETILDAVSGDVSRLKPRVSSADWQILLQHQTNIRAIENSLTAFAQTCTAPPAPSAPFGVDITDPKATLQWTELPTSFPISGGMLLTILSQALACGITNVATFQWAHAEDNLTISSVSLPPSMCNLGGQGDHNMEGERDPNLIFYDQWFASQFNTLVNDLAGIPDSGTGGSILDNSLIMWSSHLSDGSAHISDNLPITLAGSNGGYFKQGLAIRFNDVFTPLVIPANTDPNTYFLTNAWYTGAIQTASGDLRNVGTPDLSNNDLFASILDSFGLDITQVMPSATDPRFFHGLLPGVKAGT